MQRLFVIGDSVPAGANCDDRAWPERVADDDGVSLRVEASMGWNTTAIQERLDDWLAEETEPTTVLVQIGHNDAQRAPETGWLVPFARRIEAIERQLLDASAVEQYAFVGLVPLGLVDGPDTVSFSDRQPELSWSHAEAIEVATEVGHFVPIRTATDWATATTDGVHPTSEGHAVIAAAVSDWLDGETGSAAESTD